MQSLLRGHRRDSSPGPRSGSVKSSDQRGKSAPSHRQEKPSAGKAQRKLGRRQVPKAQRQLDELLFRPGYASLTEHKRGQLLLSRHPEGEEGTAGTGENLRIKAEGPAARSRGGLRAAKAVGDERGVESAGRANPSRCGIAADIQAAFSAARR